jgi:hypothetical protein
MSGNATLPRGNRKVMLVISKFAIRPDDGKNPAGFLPTGSLSHKNRPGNAFCGTISGGLAGSVEANDDRRPEVSAGGGRACG